MGNTFRKGSGEGRAAEAITGQQNILANRVINLAEDQANVSRPIRNQTANVFNNFLSTGFTPSFLDLPEQAAKTASLGIPGLENDNLLLQKQLMNQGARGGLLSQQLAQSRMNTGLQRAGLQVQDVLRQDQRDVQRAQLRQMLFGGATDFGQGGFASALQGFNSAQQGLGSAANSLTQLSGQRINQNMAKTGKAGETGGAIAGAAAAAMFMCHIAIVLYGPDSWKIWRIREYLHARSQESLLAACGVWLYRRYGPYAAELVKRYQPIRSMACWYFDKLLVRAVL